MKRSIINKIINVLPDLHTHIMKMDIPLIYPEVYIQTQNFPTFLFPYEPMNQFIPGPGH